MRRAVIVKLILSVIFLISHEIASGQTLKIARIGEVTRIDGVLENITPQTTIAIDISIKRESVRKGPYARFAQHHFGAIAPLADKDIYEITGVEINWLDNVNSSEKTNLPDINKKTNLKLSPNKSTDEHFARIQPDKTSTTVKSIEESANEAAQTIFKIRSRRIEFITGEYDESIFNSGLKTALKEMEKIEGELLDLFYGKHTISTFTTRFFITPDAEKNVYIVCRFNETNGLLNESDLSGKPIILELTPQGEALKTYPKVENTKAKKQVTNNYMVADNVDCLILDGNNELARKVIPIFQFGEKVFIK